MEEPPERDCPDMGRWGGPGTMSSGWDGTGKTRGSDSSWAEGLRGATPTTDGLVSRLKTVVPLTSGNEHTTGGRHPRRFCSQKSRNNYTT